MSSVVLGCPAEPTKKLSGNARRVMESRNTRDNQDGSRETEGCRSMYFRDVLWWEKSSTQTHSLAPFMERAGRSTLQPRRRGDISRRKIGYCRI